MIRRIACIVLAVGCLATLASLPARGDIIRDYKRCSAGWTTRTTQQQIAACTAIIVFEWQDRWTLLMALNNRGATYMKLHKYPLALADFNKALVNFPDDVLSLINRGSAYIALGQHTEAFADINHALALKPDNIFALDALANAFEATGQYENAIQNLDKVVEMRPSDVGGYERRCAARARMGTSLDVALTDCSRAIELKPGDPAALAIRALVYLRMSNFTAAIADANASLAGYDQIADVPAAIDVDDTSIGGDDEMALALYVRGLAKLKAGDTGGGNADIASAQSQDAATVDTYTRAGVKP